MYNIYQNTPKILLYFISYIYVVFTLGYFIK